MSESPGKQGPPAASPKTGGASLSPPQGSSPVAVTSGSPAASPKAGGGTSLSPPKSPSSPGTGSHLPGGNWTDGPLEADDADLEAGAEDQALSDTASSTASLSSSILEYRTIKGRTYHSDRGSAEYWGSNDDLQNESMDILHHVHTLLLDGELFMAPIKDDIQTAVDIGTGTGTWAIDFGDSYPGCEVLGTDVSPIQSDWVPPNVKFVIDDCEQEWTLEPNSIDFVHMRYLTGSIKDWFRLFAQAFTCTKPGGWFESYEASPYITSDDGTVQEDSALDQWGKIFVAGGEKIGRSFLVYEKGTQRAAMEKAGFVNIQERTVRCPMGTWAKHPRMKELGAFVSTAILADIEGYVLYMASLLGWSKEEVTVYCALYRREIRNPAIHGYSTVKVVWGQKPE